MSPLCYTAVVKICGISLVFITFAFILQKNMHPYTMKMILQEYMSSSWGHGRNAVGGVLEMSVNHPVLKGSYMKISR